MGAHNFLFEQDSAYKDKKTMTAATTITIKEIIEFGTFVINNASAIAITLPAASKAISGCERRFVNYGAGASTIVVTAGFGGAGSGADTLTTAQGDLVILYCDGTNWYKLHDANAA